MASSEPSPETANRPAPPAAVTSEASTAGDAAAPPLRVVVAVPTDPAVVEQLRAEAPRLDIVFEPRLLPPRRGVADWVGDPDYHRSDDDRLEFEALLATADALFGLPDHDPELLARVVRANPRLRWLHTTNAGGGASVRQAGLTPAELERVAVTTSAGVHAAALTEFALLGLLMGAKSVRALDADKRAHVWGGRRVMSQLADQTVLVVGLGGIGLALADVLRTLGARVVGVNRSGRGADRVDRLVTLDELPEVVGEVDAVVCCLPDSPRASGALDAAFFAAARDGLVFVNVGRGTAVDEEALVAALGSGRVGFAALDVVTREPLAADSPLFDLENVLISPHTAALTDQEEHRVARVFAENAERLLRGDELVNRMDVVAFY